MSKHKLMEMTANFRSDAEIVVGVTGCAPEKVVKSIAYLSECSDAELATWFTPTQIVRLKCAFELSKRAVYSLPDQIRAPSDAANFLMARLQNKDCEHLVVLCLNTKNRIMSTVDLYKGALNTSVVRTAEVFREAIRINAAAIIIAHNHPSGDPTPSSDDISVTRDIHAAGKLLDIDLLDHLVIGNNSWVSLRERGLGFNN